MKLTAAVILAAVLATGLALGGDKPQLSVMSMPPSVVRTVPQAGDTKVDPALTEIRVTFSKDMMTNQMWSWCSDTPESFPQFDKSKIRYLKDKRTCMLPVTLEPDKTYVIWVNSQQYTSFKDTQRQSAVPYLLVFQTASRADAALARAAEVEAIKAAQDWLAIVDKGAYDQSWNDAARYFKSAITKDQWAQAVESARKPLGRNLSRTLTAKSYKTSVPGVPDGEYVVLQFSASFENRKSAVETITPTKDKDGQWRVCGYFIK
jgi:hypothetical protein